MTQLDRLVVAIEANTKAFEDGIKRSERLLNGLGDATERGSKHQQTFASALKGTATELNSMWSIAQRTMGVLRGLGEAAVEGAQNLAAQSFFEQAGKSIERYRKATQGMISDTQLMKKANLADSMGINEKTFTSLAKVAHAAAMKTGQDFDHMFESIVVGTARSSRLLLDNLGIIISQKTANENYAAKLKEGANAALYKDMTVQQLSNSLSDYAKKVAFAEEVERKSVGMVKEAASADMERVESLATVTAELENLVDGLKEVISANAGAWAKFWTDGEAHIDSWSYKFKLFLSDVKDVAAAVMSGDFLKIFQGGSIDIDPKGARSLEEYKKQFQQMLILLETIGVSQYQAFDLLDLDPTSQEFKDLDKTVQSYILTLRKLNGITQTIDMWEPDAAIDPAQILDANKKGKGGRTPKPLRDQEYSGLNPIMESDYVSMTKAFADGLDGPIKALWMQAGQEAFSRDQTVLERFKELLDAFGKHEDALAAERSRLAEQAFYSAAFKQGGERVNGALGAVSDPFGSLQGTFSEDGFFGKMITSRLQQSDVGDLSAGLKPFADALGVATPSVGEVAGGLSALATGAIGLVKAGFEGLVQVLGQVIEAGMSFYQAAFEASTFGKKTGGAQEIFFEKMGEVWAPVFRVVYQVAAVLVYMADHMKAITGTLVPLLNLFHGLVGIVATLSSWVLNLNTGIVRLLLWIDSTLGGNVLFTGRGRKKATADYQAMEKSAAEMRDMSPADFQKYMDDLLATEDNTKATKENTATLRDLAREFHNLPSGYKIAGADFATSNPAPSSSPGGQINMEMGITGLSMSSFYRGRR